MNDLTIKQEFDNVKKELGHGVNISIINLVDQLIEKAHELRASDIHIDPLEGRVRIRFRIDGVLHDIYSFPKEINHEVISRIKILTKLRTDEHQATQDGRFRYIFSSDKKFIDFRVSIIPTYHGENAVLRLLTDKNGEHSLETLGFSESDRKKIENAIKKTNGMILSTGPTGSGKTTTMYTLIKMLNSPGVSIITIEDPIEYAVNEIKQIQVNPRLGLTFANGLRSILRQDPNIIMVGEIRDTETAHIAVNTALTGHILLSTLHTSDAATTLPRLLDMGIPEYLVASTVSIAIGQRLVRKICKDCKEKIKVKNNFTYKGKGCEACHGSGYFGRICINEVLVADNKIREAIEGKIMVEGDLKRDILSNIKRLKEVWSHYY
ncbi:MAG: Type II secretion pathway protein E [Parcubacteria group bacterium GW2011_GWB1_41_5]|nr:MAG: Type II secretion pathway protein E [Parcubacteria group bacterium GW2011_GWB1_41_5]